MHNECNKVKNFAIEAAKLEVELSQQQMDEGLFKYYECKARLEALEKELSELIEAKGQ